MSENKRPGRPIKGGSRRVSTSFAIEYDLLEKEPTSDLVNRLLHDHYSRSSQMVDADKVYPLDLGHEKQTGGSGVGG